MSLNDLVHHISSQSKKINRLIKNPDFFTSLDDSLAGWAVFKEALWGEELESKEVKQEDGTVYTLVKIHKAFLKILRLRTPWILVRAEYEETERAALERNASPTEVFLVTGQPGIGLSPRIPSSP